MWQRAPAGRSLPSARAALSVRMPLAELIAQLPTSLIGMESCTGAHEWAQRFQALGHSVV